MLDGDTQLMRVIILADRTTDEIRVTGDLFDHQGRPTHPTPAQVRWLIGMAKAMVDSPDYAKAFFHALMSGQRRANMDEVD